MPLVIVKIWKLEMSNRDREIQMLYLCSRFRREAVKATELLDPTNSWITPKTFKRNVCAETDSALRRTHVRNRDVGIDDTILRTSIALLV